MESILIWEGKILSIKYEDSGKRYQSPFLMAVASLEFFLVRDLIDKGCDWKKTVKGCGAFEILFNQWAINETEAQRIGMH